MLDAAVGFALLARHQAALLEPLQHVGGVGAVQAERQAQRLLVQARRDRERGQHAVLDRGNVEFAAFLEEHRVVDLVEPADQETGAGR